MEQSRFDALVPFEHAVADYRRWKDFEPRPDDIFVCTFGKCGTTWTQTICCNLVRPDGVFEAPVAAVSPWIEAKFVPASEMHAAIQAQTKRRVLKTHSPAESIPWYDDAKYVYVVRDGRDAFMSFCNHSARMLRMDDINRVAAERGLPEMHRYDGDPHDFFQRWMTGNYFHTVASYWEQRHRPNLLLMHYADMKTDLAGEITRLADFLDISLSEEQMAGVVERSSFDYMREHPEMVGEFDGFEGGLKGFLYKGTNGRWRDILTIEELAYFRNTLESQLSAEAVRWVDEGRAALPAALN